MTDFFQVVRLATVACPHCGIVFGVPDYYRDRKRTDKTDFHCSNGDIIHFSRKDSTYDESTSYCW